MKATYTALTLALIGCGLLTGPAHGQSMPDLKFSGFGTLSAVHSSDKNSDFVGTLFQPNGAGHTSSTSLAPDSKIGGQINETFNDKLSAVVQVVSQHQTDNTFTPQVEWANLKYQVMPGLSVRAGRIAAPSYLLSESRFVGYGSVWVRPPVEPYGVLSITSSDGVDATWRTQVAGFNNAVQAYYGTSDVKFTGGGAKSRPSWGLNDTVEIGSLTLRAGYNSLTIDLDVPSVQPLLDAATLYGMPGIANKYKLTSMPTSAVALGANYDPGNWFVMGEFIDYKGSGFLTDSRAWYLSAGYRFGTWTPFVTHSTAQARVKPETGAGPLNDAFTATLFAFSATQSTNSLGVRWDAMKNVDLKAQYDRVTLRDATSGRLVTVPGLTPNDRINVLSLALDFVF